MKKKVIISFFIFFTLYLFSQDNTSDFSERLKARDDRFTRIKSMLIDENFVPDENLKELPATFDMGGSIFLNSRMLFETFHVVTYGFEPLPNNQWHADAVGKVWGRMTIKDQCFFHLGIETLFQFESSSVIPLFNLDEFYLHWKYSIGRVVFGRTNFNLGTGLIFNGPLDGIELDVNVPYLDFKTFAGFTGLLGVFHPWFNPYSITSVDRSFVEDTNLLTPAMVLKFNDEQARRIIFALDFDINFFGQHVEPYFLLQYDVNSLYHNLNTDNDVNTFHLGINFEGRFVQNFFYKVHLSGLFGTHPRSTSGQVVPILGCALETQLRYTFAAPGYSTIITGYSLGTGNSEGTGQWSSYSSDSTKGFWSDKYDGEYQNKFYYFGNFDGGYVLEPILSNIQALMFKYMVSPVSGDNGHFTMFFAFYQTFKVWSTGAISDDRATENSHVVGSEFDTGFLANIGPFFTFGVDFGFFIPEYAYLDRTLRFKMGATIGWVF